MRNEGLIDGTTVLLREMTMDDVERSHRFFLDLPPEDRRYLRVDVTKRDVVERRIRHAVAGGAHRIVALADDRDGYGWRELMAEAARACGRKPRFAPAPPRD